MAKQTPEEKRRDELIDELPKGYNGPDSFWGESGLFASLKGRPSSARLSRFSVTPILKQTGSSSFMIREGLKKLSPILTSG